MDCSSATPTMQILEPESRFDPFTDVVNKSSFYDTDHKLSVLWVKLILRFLQIVQKPLAPLDKLVPSDLPILDDAIGVLHDIIEVWVLIHFNP
jgi:tryptophan 2,3-dioxygenase